VGNTAIIEIFERRSQAQGFKFLWVVQHLLNYAVRYGGLLLTGVEMNHFMKQWKLK
jgi:hypothetical protein